MLFHKWTHDKFVQVDVIFVNFNIAFILDIQEHVFIQIIKMPHFDTGVAGGEEGCFPNCYNDMILETKYETCS